ELLGFSRQAFYKRHLNEWTLHEADILNTSIVLYCQYLRLSENLPRAGFRELYVLCKQHFPGEVLDGSGPVLPGAQSQ
ncbi:hypothetical protein HQ47_02560, partial [Porphyromonas macacae]